MYIHVYTQLDRLCITVSMDICFLYICALNCCVIDFATCYGLFRISVIDTVLNVRIMYV